MKIACISDTHGIFLPEIPEGVDFVVHAGDIGPDRKPLEWFLGPFKTWLSDLEKRDIGVFATWGNHDFIGQKQDFSKILPSNTTIAVDKPLYIADTLDPDDESDDIQTLKIWFSPWSNLFGNWAWMETEGELATRFRDIEDDCDIIVSHGPPKGYGDRIYWDGTDQHAGSQSLLDAFLANKAKYLICGHIHEAAGIYEIPGTDKKVINVSQVNEDYEPVLNAVKIFEV